MTISAKTQTPTGVQLLDKDAVPHSIRIGQNSSVEEVAKCSLLLLQALSTSSVSQDVWYLAMKKALRKAIQENVKDADGIFQHIMDAVHDERLSDMTIASGFID